jgi:hypothetical protein
MIIFVWLAVGWILLSFFISPLLGALFLIAAGTKPARIIEETPKRDPLEVQARRPWRWASAARRLPPRWRISRAPGSSIANGKERTVSIFKTFLVSAKWNFRLNGGWIVAFNPTEGLEARRRFNSDREAIAEVRRLAKLGAAVRIDEETPLWLGEVCNVEKEHEKRLEQA